VENLGTPKEGLWQAIVLLWQANKQEFFSNNMHGLRPGTYLTIPPNLVDEMAALSKAEAQRLVAEQWETWQTLRRAPGGQQQGGPAAEKEPVVLAKNPLPLPETPPPPVEAKPPQPAAVAPPTRDVTPVIAPDMRSLLQRVEELVQRSAQAEHPGGAVTFVNSAELQGVLQTLEERLLQSVQESLKPIADMQQNTVVLNRFASQGEKPTLLEAWLPSSSMIYILALENALLLLLAGGILWRWYRSRT
jgi:hypothetical protein